MSLVDRTLFETVDKVKIAIDRIKNFEPEDGFYLAFSGGKDSIVLFDLTVKSGVKYDAHFNVTTVDPPELLRFIKEHYPTVKWDHPEKSMWQLIVERRMPPTRKVRYCCQELKERGGHDRIVLTGVRWAESVKRNRRALFEICYKDKTKKYLHPILDWSEDEVWEYIRKNNLSYCSLYDEGRKRIGCVGCPMVRGQQFKDFVRFPRFKELYIRAFQKMVEKRIADGLETKWKNGAEVYRWWVTNDNAVKGDPDQTILFE